MLISTILYNLAMAAVDVATLVCLCRRRTPAAWFQMLAAAGALAVVMAVVFAVGAFGLVWLASFGLFLHAPVLLAGSAVLLWGKHRKTGVASAVLCLLLFAVAVDAFLIEPYRLEVSHIELVSPKITRPVRIVVLADLQTDRIGDYERAVLRRVMGEDPDVILLAGDYLQASGQRLGGLQRELNAFLHEIEFAAPDGVYAVAGNVDLGSWPEIFDGLPVTAVKTTESFEAAGLRWTCLSMRDSGRRSLSIPADNERFHVVLGHRPDFALAGPDADLLVAGHTHGGQVCLPIIGPLFTASGVPRSWASGVTDLPGGGKLLVSRGVGMERGSAPRLRFLCRPELVVVDLAPIE